jgi:hypothetical protein
MKENKTFCQDKIFLFAWRRGVAGLFSLEIKVKHFGIWAGLKLLIGWNNPKPA